VQRNRARRRLRAALRELGDELEPGTAYLVGAGPEVLTLPWPDLVDLMRDALRSLPAS